MSDADPSALSPLAGRLAAALCDDADLLAVALDRPEDVVGAWGSVRLMSSLLAAADQALARAAEASEREQRFVAAIAAWVDGDLPRAIALHALRTLPQVLLCIALFTACTLHVRWRFQAVRLSAEPSPETP